MIVRCLRTSHTSDVGLRDAAGWITVGETYVVLSLDWAPRRPLYLRLITDEGDEGLFPASLFKVIDSRLSVRWRAAIDDEGAVSIGPPAWHRPGFWADYYDDARGVKGVGTADNAAGRAFDLEVRELLAEFGDQLDPDERRSETVE